MGHILNDRRLYTELLPYKIVRPARFCMTCRGSPVYKRLSFLSREFKAMYMHDAHITWGSWRVDYIEDRS